jgi:hypothetical protein
VVASRFVSELMVWVAGGRVWGFEWGVGWVWVAGESMSVLRHIYQMCRLQILQ